VDVSRLAGLALLVAVLAASGAWRVAAGATHQVATVDPRVLADTAAGRSAHFLVRMRRQADVVTAVAGAPGRSAQGEQAVTALQGATAGQADVERVLRRLGASYRPFWVVDALAVKGDRRVVEALAGRSDIAAIEPDRSFRGVALEQGRTAPSAPQGVEWNVRKIGAPAVWALGYTGQGLVYANADTGVTWDVPALRPHYRGWDGSTADHAYNWWDAVHGDIDGDGSNPCGFNLTAPCDDNKVGGISHGTHTMGTAVGDDGNGNQIGVAPGAKWIACRNMDEGVGRPSTYIECLQFFLAPTDLNGANPDPSKRPNAIGNSYLCPPEELCTAGSLQTAVDNVRAAGIFMAVSAGNDGRNGCSTVSFPPGIYDSSTTVGATDANDQIAAFSSRGPVTADGSGRLKPDLVAPGVNVRSATATGYAFASGTSMASPHVAAAVLLLWSAFPELKGNVDATEQLLEQTAVHLTTTDGCGGGSTMAVPNNTYGYGRIDVYAAFQAEEKADPPDLSVTDVSVDEGDSGRTLAVFTVALSRGSSRPVTVHYATHDGSATAGADFVSSAGTLTFAPGERSKTVRVAVIGDTRREPEEGFTLDLTDAQNAQLGKAQGVGTIRNDDVDVTKPVLSALRIGVGAKVGGRAAVTVRLRLSEPSTVTCVIERRRVSWLRVGSFRRSAPVGASALAAPFRVAAGTFRARCVPRDRAGNVGAALTAGFRVGA
jgi:serine protease AprX